MPEKRWTMHEIYGYGYVTKETQNITRSTIYKALRGRFILQDNIFIDVLQSNDKRKQFRRLLEVANESDTIVIMHKRTLGSTKEFRSWWYELTFNRKINLLIVDDNDKKGVDYYSTVDFSFNRFPDDIIVEKWEKLQTDTFERKTRKVGRKSAEISTKFINTYWAYQSFFISVDEAYQHLAVSKQTFYTLCKHYELTEAYKEELASRKELHDYPKRGGLNENIERLLQAVEQRKIPLDEACIELDIARLLPEEYHRYLLAKLGGRKIQFEYEAKHHINDYFKTKE